MSAIKPLVVVPMGTGRPWYPVFRCTVETGPMVRDDGAVTVNLTVRGKVTKGRVGLWHWATRGRFLMKAVKS